MFPWYSLGLFVMYGVSLRQELPPEPGCRGLLLQSVKATFKVLEIA